MKEENFTGINKVKKWRTVFLPIIPRVSLY